MEFRWINSGNLVSRKLDSSIKSVKRLIHIELSYNRLITCSSLQSRPSVGVGVLVDGNLVRNLPVGADLGRVAELGPHLRAWSDDLHLQDDDHLLGLAAHLVADVLLHLDDGEGGQLVAVHHVVELSGQHGEAVAELAVTEKQSVPGGQ